MMPRCSLLIVFSLSLTACHSVWTPTDTPLTAQVRAVRVESKWTLRDDQASAARSQLNLKHSDAEQRDVYFYDTAQLDLYHQGLILRARKVYDGADDSTVKLRPMTEAQAGVWLGESGFKCELDATGTTQVPSCSFSDTPETGQIDDVRDELLSPKKLFSPDQEDFAVSQVNVSWSSLLVLGPTPAEVWKKSPSSLAYPITIEQWTLPSGAVVTEVSTKTSQADASSASTALKTYLQNKGLIIASDQDSKTARTLEEWTR